MTNFNFQGKIIRHFWGKLIRQSTLIVFTMLKFVRTIIKKKLLNHHAISYLVFMISTLYLLVTMITIIIRITCY